MNLFARDRERLTGAVLKLTAIVEAMIRGAIRALGDSRPEEARRVIRGDEAVDRLEVAIEEKCLRLLALHDPVAGDLRWVAAVLKINHELERMADLAVGIARRALVLADGPRDLPIPEDLETMSVRVAEMVRGSLDAFLTTNADRARAVIALDDEVDRLRERIVGALLAMMRACPERIEPGLQLFAAASHLERIADHATNIAEEVVFLKEGAIIRHHRRPRGQASRRRPAAAVRAVSGHPA